MSVFFLLPLIIFHLCHGLFIPHFFFFFFFYFSLPRKLRKTGAYSSITSSTAFHINGFCRFVSGARSHLLLTLTEECLWHNTTRRGQKEIQFLCFLLLGWRCSFAFLTAVCCARYWSRDKQQTGAAFSYLKMEEEKEGLARDSSRLHSQ